MKKFGKGNIMENKNITKEEIKKRILEIFDIENRSINIREITTILKEEFKIIRSQPVIKNYLDDLIKEKELRLE